MLIADSQVHVWGANTPERPWPANHHPPHRPVPFSMSDLLAEMAGAGVGRVVIVPPSWEGFRNDLALEAARLHPGRFAVMGLLDTGLPASRGRMAAWRRQPGMLGVRLIFARRTCAPSSPRGARSGCGRRRSGPGCRSWS